MHGALTGEGCWIFDLIFTLPLIEAVYKSATTPFRAMHEFVRKPAVFTLCDETVRVTGTKWIIANKI